MEERNLRKTRVGKVEGAAEAAAPAPEGGKEA